MRAKSFLLPRHPLLTACLVLSLAGCGGSGDSGESDFGKVSDKNTPPPENTNGSGTYSGSQPIATGAEPIPTGSRQEPASSSTPPTVVGSPRVSPNSPAPVAALRGLVDFADNTTLNINGYALTNNTGVTISAGETTTVAVMNNQVTALTIDPQITGIISALASDRSTLVVAGQKIVLNSTTVFAATSVDTIASGDAVTISGVPLQAGVFAATKITQLASNETTDLYPTAVTGMVEQLDEMQRTFRLGQLRVAYANSIDTTTLHDGAWIHVRGNAGNGTILIADGIVPLVDSTLLMSATTANSFSLTGLINSTTASQTLVILGQRVVINTDTVVSNASVADLLPQSLVTVTGHFDAAVNGIVADNINILEPAASATP